MTEKKKNNTRAQKTLLVFSLILCVILLGAVIYLLRTREVAPTAETTKEWDTGIAEDAKGKADDGILIPGYDTVVMDAGVTAMPMSIGNPKENDCLIKISILLEDETVLYQSEFIAPGQGMTEVPLSQSLDAGTYDTIARFECFMDNATHTPLNVADSGFVLIVEGGE